MAVTCITTHRLVGHVDLPHRLALPPCPKVGWPSVVGPGASARLDELRVQDTGSQSESRPSHSTTGVFGLGVARKPAGMPTEPPLTVVLSRLAGRDSEHGCRPLPRIAVFVVSRFLTDMEDAAAVSQMMVDLLGEPVVRV